MPNPTRLLRRQPKIDPARVEIARSITMARLSSLFDPDSTDENVADEGAEDQPGAERAIAGDAPTAGVEPMRADMAAVDDVASMQPEETFILDASIDADEAVSLGAVEVSDSLDSTPPPDAAFAAVDAADLEPDAYRSGHEPTDTVEATIPVGPADDERPEDDNVASAPTVDDEPPAPSEGEVPVPAYAQDPRTDPYGWELPVASVDAARQPDPIEPLTTPSGDADPAPPEAAPSPPKRSHRAPRPAAPRSRPVAARGPEARVASGPVAVIASCPYCALLLEPPPTADRRCTRCRQRIIVRRAHGRAVYLTEAAVQVFESERRRVANTGRWTRDRERWLKLAGSVEAPTGRIARLERAALSDEVVANARALYETTIERLIRAARRDRRWDDVARLRRDQALALHRATGSPVPPLGEIAALHREGALAALRGIGEIAREAALVGVECCDACRADVGRQFRISSELREPRLPHAGCPAGLCRCRWELTSRDRDVIGGYLRRHARLDRVAPSA